MPSKILTEEQRERKRAADRLRQRNRDRTMVAMTPEQREKKRLADAERDAWKQAYRYYRKWCAREGLG